MPQAVRRRLEQTARLNCFLLGSFPDTRSRLADFHANCRASYRTLTSCPADNYQACLGSYAGMIGKLSLCFFVLSVHPLTTSLGWGVLQPSPRSVKETQGTTLPVADSE